VRARAVGYLQCANISVARYHLLVSVLDGGHIGVAERACLLFVLANLVVLFQLFGLV